MYLHLYTVTSYGFAVKIIIIHSTTASGGNALYYHRNLREVNIYSMKFSSSEPSLTLVTTYRKWKKKNAPHRQCHKTSG